MADRPHSRPDPRSWLPGIAIAMAIGLCYGPFLDRGFTSEDFLLIRFLADHPPWQGFWAALGEPWLGISGILFIRPISTLLYGIEIAAFGAVPFAYNLVHLLVHLGNALLLASTARALGLELAAIVGAGILFGLYPLHPNAVLFTASFATIIGAAFVLGSFRLYLWSQATGRRGPWFAAMALFVLALGSYETSIVLPVWLAAHEVLTARRDRSWRPSLVSILPFGLLVGCYLVLRRWVLGSTLGGYADLGHDILRLDVMGWLRDLGISIVRLHAPIYAQPLARSTLFLGLLLVVVGPSIWFGLRARRVGLTASGLRTWLLGAVVMVSSMAPFAFRPAVPGNGRYWYLAAAGAALSLAALAQSSAQALGRRAVPWIAFGAVVAASAWLLLGYLGTYRLAARTAASVQRQLGAEPWCAAGETVFLAGTPQFISTAGTPVAQVFHYGLWDSVHAPFAAAECKVFPLPQLLDSELGPLAGRPVLRWEAASPGGVHWIGHVARTSAGLGAESGVSGESLADIHVVPPDQQPLDPAEPRSLAFRFFPAPVASSYRLLVSARGNATVVDLTSLVDSPEGIAAMLPGEFLAIMRRLYGGEVFWWLEGRDSAGVLVASSALQTTRLAPDPLASR